MEHLLQLKKLYSTWKNSFPDRIESLENTSASSRQYFRIYADNKSVIGVYNTDLKENRAFFHFTKTFKNADIHVPELYFISDNEAYYLLEDLGDTNLLDLLKEEGESDILKILYKKAIDQLLKMQVYGLNKIDFADYSYPRAEFDTQSVLWDLNYFKYYFLKVSGLTFDEQLLENDFQFLAKEIGKQKWIAFMFRDFQARNIQVRNNDVWLIDYQGGRKGPMLYDLVSLLYQASAQLSPKFRNELKAYYKQEAVKKMNLDSRSFETDFDLMVFIRIIQTLGAYGFRGLIEKKSYFINSIPLALENMDALLKVSHFNAKFTYLIDLLNQLVKLKSNFVPK
jgi:aminoglycoside/choline kinase family phosphotransferase